MTIKTVHPVAKRLYKTGKYSSYAQAVAAAWKQGKPGKKAIAKIKPASRKRAAISGVTGSADIKQANAEIKRTYMQKIGELSAQKMVAKTKAEKKRIHKQINALLKTLRTISN